MFLGILTAKRVERVVDETWNPPHSGLRFNSARLVLKMSFSRALPNELLHIIFCNVLGAYVHSLILTPAVHGPRWHGHYALRSVSRRFKAIIDSIWLGGVGPPETWSVHPIYPPTQFIISRQQA